MSRFEEVLSAGDDALIAAQRLAEWTASAHDLEEDIALSNIALDLLGQARALLTYAGELEDAGRDEDALAFGRDDRQFRNCQLVELPRGDFGVTITRLLLLAAWQSVLYERWADGDDERLAAIGAKASKEVAYHLDHATQWTVRLGDGTAESHRRIRAAFDDQWPYTFELVEDSDRDAWLAIVQPVLREAGISQPSEDALFRPHGGRAGFHTEHLGYLLAEMQHLHRSHPGAKW